MKSGYRKPSTLMTIAASLAVAASFGLVAVGVFGGSNSAHASIKLNVLAPAINPKSTAFANSLSDAFEAVYKADHNSVVNINVIKEIPQSQGINPGGPMQLPPGFSKMLPPGAFPLVPSNPGPEKLYGTGSGVIISSNGYIVTNNHVVSNATKITVTLADHRRFKGTVVGTDPKTDLAVVKIAAHDLPALQFANSNHVRVGQWVIAIGSPFGFRQTVTQGIISAEGRTDVNIIAEHNPKLQGLTYEDFLQTDAAINPGNSGGPLLNLNGRVVGINSAIATNTGSFNGIGFSIPANEVNYVTHALITYGKVVRGYLGVTIEDVRNRNAEKIAHSFGYDHSRGVLVQQIMPDSPGAKGGLKAGDVITAIDHQKVRTMNQLRDTIAETRPGKDVTLGIFRRGKTINLTFPVGTQPASISQVAMAGGGEQPGVVQSNSLGITVASVSSEIAKQYHLAAPEGVMVSKVNPNGVAAGAGINPGDIILRVQGHKISSVNEFKSVLKKLSLSSGVRMYLRGADGSERFVFVQQNN
jgi:serine protease Do